MRQDVCRSSVSLLGDVILFVLNPYLIAVAGREFQRDDFAELFHNIRIIA